MKIHLESQSMQILIRDRSLGILLIKLRLTQKLQAAINQCRKPSTLAKDNQNLWKSSTLRWLEIKRLMIWLMLLCNL